jgi:hypothetical protein
VVIPRLCRHIIENVHLRHYMRRASTRLLRYYSTLIFRPVDHKFSMVLNGEVNGHASWQGVSLAELPKSHTFTANLPPDPLIPSPQASKEAPQQRLRVSRQVLSALFTWVAPENNENPQLLATSWKALRDLGLRADEAESNDFLALMSGNRIYDEHYPWGIYLVFVLMSAKLWGLAIRRLGISTRGWKGIFIVRGNQSLHK